jgi:transcriptional regulator with XRE-family HTH domain
VPACNATAMEVLTLSVYTATLVSMMDAAPLGDLLRDLRERQGRSLREVARALEVDPAHLSRVERGAKPASATVLKRASEYYAVPRELLALSHGEVPEDVVALLQRHPEVIEELRKRYGP